MSDPLQYIECDNAGCPSYQVPKSVPPGLPTNIPTMCGECGTVLVDADDADQPAESPAAIAGQ